MNMRARERIYLTFLPPFLNLTPRVIMVVYFTLERFEMRDLERHLKKITRLAEAAEWISVLLRPLQSEAASIYGRICPTRGMSLDNNFAAFKKALEAVADGSPHESDVFLEAVEKLPRIAERIKTLPKSDVRELRMMQEFEVKALSAFIEACKLGISWAAVYQVSALRSRGETDYDVIASIMGSTRDHIETTVKVINGKWGGVRGLEAAMFIRFTQAYKWWKAESKAESAFWDMRLRNTG